MYPALAKTVGVIIRTLDELDALEVDAYLRFESEIESTKCFMDGVGQRKQVGGIIYAFQVISNKIS